jgi:hypothetical protein
MSVPAAFFLGLGLGALLGLLLLAHLIVVSGSDQRSNDL